MQHYVLSVESKGGSELTAGTATFGLTYFAALSLDAGAASADTFIVPSDKGTTSDEPMLAASHKGGACVYGDKAVQLGDTVIMAESKMVLVCANVPQDPVFYPLSPAGAAQVVKATPKTRG